MCLIKANGKTQMAACKSASVSLFTVPFPGITYDTFYTHTHIHTDIFLRLKICLCRIKNIYLWWYTFRKLLENSYFLPGKSHGRRSCGLQSMGSLGVRYNWATSLSLSCIGEGNGNHSSVLAWRIPGMAKPGRLPSLGSHRVGHDWSDLAAAAATSWPINNPPTHQLSCSFALQVKCSVKEAESYESGSSGTN